MGNYQGCNEGSIKCGTFGGFQLVCNTDGNPGGQCRCDSSDQGCNDAVMYHNVTWLRVVWALVNCATMQLATVRNVRRMLSVYPTVIISTNAILVHLARSKVDISIALLYVPSNSHI